MNRKFRVVFAALVVAGAALVSVSGAASADVVPRGLSFVSVVPHG